MRTPRSCSDNFSTGATVLAREVTSKPGAGPSRYPRGQLDDAEVHGLRHPAPAPRRPAVGDVPAHLRRRSPVTRLPPVADAPFRPLYACVVIALGSRRVASVGVARHPTDAWLALRRRDLDLWWPHRANRRAA